MRLRCFLLLLALSASAAQAQAPAQLPGLPRPTAGPGAVVAYARHQAAGAAAPFDPRLRPFYHGVASGDPLPDGVILWTRVTPDVDGLTTVAWRVATDPAMTNVVQSGETTTDAARDYTVKVDVRGLQPGTTYYYDFGAQGARSLTGRTRTAPAGAADHLRFAVVSCSNYAAGYFNAYGRIADRADLDAVFHLGDYLYEYAPGVYGGTRAMEPAAELLRLDDYRIRHSLHKLDPDARRAHQQHPFIAVWDDHEVANDAYKDGAENHQPDTEGPWSARKAAALQAYFEWMPIRQLPQHDTQIYRKLSYGDLADVFMIDTRLQARDKQLAPKGGNLFGAVDTTAWFDPGRTLLGAEQFDWLTTGLAASKARWKVIGNQVMMMNLAPHPVLPPTQTFTNLDSWDGYPAERARLFEFIKRQGVQNLVVATGDIHSSWAGDLPPSPFVGYNPATGAGSLGVEMVTTSITAKTFGEAVYEALRAQQPGLTLEQAVGLANLLLGQAYPQIKAFDVLEHGYYVLDLTPEKAQGDWYFVDVDAPTSAQREGFHVYTPHAANSLVRAAAPADGKPNPPALAPDVTRTSAEASDLPAAGALLVVGSYPNPAAGAASLHYVLGRPGAVRITLFDAAGREVGRLLEAEQGAGVYRFSFDVSRLAAGAYFYRVEAGGQAAVRSLVVQR